MKGRFTLTILIFSYFFWSNPAFSQLSENDCNALVLSAEIQQSCVERNSGSIDLKITGGMAPYQIEWMHGARSSQVKSLAPGQYRVKVRDVLGCEQQANFTVATLAPLQARANLVHNRKPGKKQGSMEILTSGGQAPYKYSWISNAKQFTPGFIEGASNQAKLPAGWYRVVVIDGAGCYQEIDAQLK